jgi:hypothetical protein
MLKHSLLAASLALLMSGPAVAGDSGKRDDRDRGRDRGNGIAWKRDLDDHRDRDRDRGRDDDRDDDKRDWSGWRDDLDRHRDRRDDDRHRRDWRDDDHDRHDWRHSGWTHHGNSHDGWRYYRSHDHRHWRYVPPYRYSAHFGYRSGYELAWRDWLRYGRYDRYWRRNAFYGYGVGYEYRSGYEAGWRDAAMYYGRGYRPNYWAYDSRGGWYFSFSLSG